MHLAVRSLVPVELWPCGHTLQPLCIMHSTLLKSLPWLHLQLCRSIAVLGFQSHVLTSVAWCRDASSRARLRVSQFPADRQTRWCVISVVNWLYAAWRSMKS